MIHQEEINLALVKLKNYSGVEFISEVLKELKIEYEVEGLDNIDLQKRYVVVSNHPMGGLDGLVLLELFGKLFSGVKSMTNDLLYHLEPLKPVFIPVNKYGRQSQQSVAMLKESYLSNDPILYFPAGLCSRKIKGEITDLEWRKSYLTQAVKHKRDILPLYFEGRNSNLFYRLANLRVRLGIKFNFETILLPHEMFRQKNRRLKLYIGKAISHEELTDGKTLQEWNSEIRKRVYNLK